MRRFPAMDRMSSIANQPMSPAVAAEWRQLYRDLKRTKAQLIGQMRRLELLIEQTATIVGEIEKGRIYVATIEKPVDVHSDSVRAVE